MPQLQETGPITVTPQRFVAIYDNVAECDDELAFRAGDILTVIEKDTGGLEGWWLCSLRGRQGICPGNRLRPVGTDTALQRKSWPNKVIMPQKYGDVYLYDSPRSDQMQYDVPAPLNEGSVVECYDKPRPLIQLTPSSSISSLTTDSNRSSLIQDYDVPRPPRTVQPQVYDVPKEFSLSLGEALDKLGKAEAEALAGVRGVVGEVGPSATAPPHRLPHLRSALVVLRPALHRLTAFAHQVLASSVHSGLEGKLKPLVAAVVEAERVVEEEGRTLDAVGWDPVSSARPLEAIIAAATPLTDDIRQLASFIQGNSTLLFKKNSGWTEDYDYVNLEGRGEDKQEETFTLDPAQKQLLMFWSSQCRLTVESLTGAIKGLLKSVETNQPPRVFVGWARAAIAAGSRVEAVGTAAMQPTTRLHESLEDLAKTASTAATRFPSVSAVQAMVDSVISISHHAAALRHSLASAHY